MATTNPINALFEDPKMLGIRNAVSQKNDAIPFMLLPVRIETRFKQVPRKRFEKAIDVDVLLEGLGAIHVLAVDVLQTPNAPNLSSLITELTNFNNAVDKEGVLLIKEKGWLKQLYGDLKKDVDAIILIATPGFATEAAQLRAAIDATGTLITNIGVREDIALKKVKDFIARMEQLLSAYNSLTGPRAGIPYLNIKNKKDLYSYITTTLDNTLAFYAGAADAVKEIQFIDKIQVTRITELQAAIKAVIATFPDKIAEIHKGRNGEPDAAWVGFSNTTVKEKVALIQTAMAAFDGEAIPALQAIPAPPPMETGELLTHGIQTLIKLKKYNTGIHEGYEQNRRFKKYIQPRITTLTKLSQNPIPESKPGQAQRVQRLYAALSEGINTSATIVTSFAAKNNSQKHGLSVISAFIKDQALPAFGAFTDVAGTEPFPKAVITPKAAEMQNQLWVRIYPDDIFVDTHEEALTPNEISAGKQFWKVWWAASLDSDAEMAAWRTLCTALGTKRASWVARLLKPDSSNAQNTAALMARPSAKLTDSMQLLNSSYELLKKLDYAKPAVQLLSAAETTTALQSVFANIKKAVSLITTLTQEQDYLIEKAKSTFIRTASFVNRVIERGAQLKPEETAQCAASLSALQQTVVQVEALQEALLKLPATAQNAFIATLGEPFVYPEVTTKDKDWSIAPHCMCLPDQFVVITMKGSTFCHLQTGNPIPEKLPIGLNPEKFEDGSLYSVDDNGDLQIDPDLKWMTEYDEAVAKGMAVTLDITQDQFEQGFDRVIVLGVKNADATTSKALIEDLFTNHIYAPDGMGFLKIATPTNNTQYRKSGYDPGNDVQQRYDIEIAAKKFSAAPPDVYKAADGKWFCDAIGIEYDVLQYANDATQTEISNALSVNRALWSGTLGHYMEEMFDFVFTYDNIQRTEAHFTNHCFSRGSLPSIRVGVQPYGILPTTAFSRLQLYDGIPPLTRQDIVAAQGNQALSLALNAKLGQRFDMRLHTVLKILYPEFQRLSLKNVVNYSNLQEGTATTASRFVEMLCLHPVSLNYTYRQGINIARGPNASPEMLSGNFGAGDSFGPNGLGSVFRDLMLDGVFFPSFNFLDEESPDPDAKKQEDSHYSRIQRQFDTARNFGNRFINLTPDLKGPIADTKPLSFTEPISTSVSTGSGAQINYIQWLLENFADTILAGNNVANMPSNSLLFLMLRQALLQAYQEAALAIFQTEGMISEDDRRETGSRYHYHFRTWDPVAKKAKNHYVTKWHLMFKHVNELPDLLRNSAFSTFPFFSYILNENFKSLAHYLDQLLAVPLDSLNPPQLATVKVFNASHKVHFQKLHSVRYAIKQLQNLPGAELEILLGEHVDIATHRLDAWLLSLVNQRLQTQRQKQAKGLFIGAYGYVENLKPNTNDEEYKNAILSEFKLPEGATVYNDPDNQGFIHAGSIGQAITAAVLRSAYATNVEAEDSPNRLAVNLTSSRVRMALNLISGMRNGQSVGALLGFQFERGLHERYKEVELDKFIQPFRKAFPLKQQVEETADGNGAVYESLTVDGNAVLQLVYDSLHWFELKSEKTIGDLLKESSFATVPQKIKDTIDGALQAGDDKPKIYNIIIEEIDRMGDALDALGDLATSESVYQIVKGNYVRAAAVLEALSQGKNLPDPQVIETYRSGTVLTHRVLFQMPTFISSDVNTFTAPPGWPAAATPRASAEPSFNHWLGIAMGAAINYNCAVTVTDALNVQTKTDFTLDKLGWQPIDIYHLAGGEAGLKNNIILEFINKSGAETKVAVSFTERDAAWPVSTKTVSELFYFLKTVQNLFGSSRYAGAGDYRMPDSITDTANAGKHNSTDLTQRITAAVTALTKFNDDVKGETFVAAVLDGTTAADQVVLTAADYMKIVVYLNRATLLGITSAAVSPFVMKQNSTEHYLTLFNQLLTTFKESSGRQEQAIALQTGIAAIDKPSFKVEKLTELAKVVFGKNMIVIPTFAVDNTLEIVTQSALPATATITRNGGALLVEDWLQSISKVRARMKDLQQYVQTSDMFETPLPPMQPVQFPYDTGDYWLGIEYPSDYTPKGDKLSLMLINHPLIGSQTVQAGLILDEWLEIIPGRQETSGIVFNYNQPNATPPQSILLAVTPNATNEWEWDDLVHTVIDTIELSKIRAVEPDHLDASYLSHALHAVVSEIPPPQVAGEDPNALGVQAVMDFSVIQ